MLLAVAVIAIAGVLVAVGLVSPFARLTYKGRATVSAFDQAAVPMVRLAGGSADIGLDLAFQKELYLFPDLVRDDGRDEIFMAVVFLGRKLLTHMVDLTGVGSVANHHPRIEFVFQHAADALVLPQESVGDLGLVADAFAEGLELVVALGLDALLVENGGDGLEAVALQVEGVDAAHDGGLFLNDDYLARVLVLEVAHRRDDDEAFSLLLTIPGADLFGDVAAVHVIEDALETDHELVILVARVDVFGDRQDADTVLAEKVDEDRRLCLVSAQTGEVFDDDGIDGFLLDFLIDLFDAVSVEVHAADIVIEGFTDDGIAVGFGVLDQDVSLIGQRVEFLVLIAGQAVV